MISQRNKDKENIIHAQPLKSGNMLYKAIEVLKQDKQNLIKENEQRERYHQEQKKKLRIQLQGYKRKIAQLTQANILGSLIKKEQTNLKIDTQSTVKIRKLQLQIEHLKKIICEKQKVFESNKLQTKQLEKKIKILAQEKQRHLQLSLTQKINMQQKLQLLQKQTQSKKKIIEGLKKQIEKVNKLEFELNKKQRQIVKRGRDMNKYQEQFNDYYTENEKKYQRKIQNLQQQNSFLRKQVKKIVKKIKVSCHCQGQAQQWKQKLYQVGRQLARARVQLGKKDINKQNNTQVKKKLKEGRQKKLEIQEPENEDSSSIDSLSLSQESENDDNNYKKTEKKR